MSKKDKSTPKVRDPKALAVGHLKRAEQEIESAKQDIEKLHYAKSVHSSYRAVNEINL